MAHLVLLPLGTGVLTVNHQVGPTSAGMRVEQELFFIGDCPEYFLGRTYSCHSQPMISTHRENIGCPDVGLCVLCWASGLSGFETGGSLVWTLVPGPLCTPVVWDPFCAEIPASCFEALEVGSLWQSGKVL